MRRTRGWLEVILNNQSGVAMALALVMVFIVMMVSVSLVSLAAGEYQTAGGAERSRQAFQIAEAGVARATFELNRDDTWDDSALATANIAGGQWRPLYDRAANVTDRDFPASPDTLGTYSVELCPYGSGGQCPTDTVYAARCDAASCMWLRATGRVPGASRRIEVLLGRVTAGNRPMNYSAGPINIGAGGGGNGTFTLHGSLYIASCIDPDGGGPQPCIGLTMQGDGAILNDTPAVGDTAAPYTNEIFVRGAITGQGNSWQIGLDVQPMWGVHAFGWASSWDNQIDALQKDNSVPALSFPDPSKACEPSGQPRSCLINRLYLPAGDPDRIVANNSSTAYVCGLVGACTGAQWTTVDLTNTGNLLQLTGTTKVVIPDATAPINCRDGAAGTARCNNAVATPSSGDVNGGNDFTLVFNGRLGSGVKLVTQRDAYLHVKSRLELGTAITYEGFTTWLVENTGQPPASPAILIGAPLTPACAASQTTCTQTFGQTNGNTYAFAVGPANPATAGGGVYIVDAQAEVDAVLIAHGTLKNDRGQQKWYGLFIANLLDWDNNPSIFPVPNLVDNLPPGIPSLFKPSSGVRAFIWREVF